MVLGTNNNSAFNLKYKLVIKIKDMMGVSEDYLLSKFDKMFLDISKGYGITRENIRLNNNVLLINFFAKPNTEISKFINTYKSSTSRRIKNELGKSKDIKEFWNKGYLLLTLGEDNEDIISKYIQSS